MGFKAIVASLNLGFRFFALSYFCLHFSYFSPKSCVDVRGRLMKVSLGKELNLSSQRPDVLWEKERRWFLAPRPRRVGPVVATVLVAKGGLIMTTAARRLDPNRSGARMGWARFLPESRFFRFEV